jgi:anti-anti-sigma factor
MTEPQPNQWLEREDFGDLTVLRIQVTMLRADDATEGVFDSACSLVDSAGRPRLVLNLERVVLLASAAVGRLVLLMRKAASAGGKLVLCKPSRPVDAVLRACHLSDVLPSYADEREALQALSAHGGPPL